MAFELHEFTETLMLATGELESWVANLSSQESS